MEIFDQPSQFEQSSKERPKTAKAVKKNSIDIMEFFNYIVEDLQAISDRLYLLENSLSTTGNSSYGGMSHKYPRSLSTVRHRQAIKMSRESVNVNYVLVAGYMFSSIPTPVVAHVNTRFGPKSQNSSNPKMGHPTSFFHDFLNAPGLHCTKH